MRKIAATDFAEMEQRVLAHATREPAYPGAPIREQMFVRADDIGNVRIMDYGKDMKTRYRVASFLPGYETSFPGDTPKTNPERDEWCATAEEANDFFDIYVGCAKLNEWVPVSPTGRSA